MMRCRFVFIGLTLLHVLTFSGCGDDEIVITDAGATDVIDTTGDTPADDLDVEADPVVDVSEDADVVPDADADADAEPGIEIGGACEEQWDCDEGWACLNSQCHRFPVCGGASNWPRCLYAIEEIDPDIAYRSACVDSRCVVLCEIDEHCPDGESCADFGMCLPWEGDLSGIDPGGDARADFQAGVGEVLFNFPVGAPLGGYGERAAYHEGRYGESLQPSAGQMHGLYVRAVLLDNGERQMMIIRAPFIFPSMAMHEQVARALQAETGDDWRDSLIISATHTHSGPARYWHVPGDAALAVGALGIGEFNQEIYDWLVGSLIDSALAALEDRAPAQLGWEIIEDFDRDDHIGRDRWSETPPFDDNRVLLIRIDDADGVPRAVLFSFGAHASDNGESYASGDVHYGAERNLEFELGERFERHIPAMYINQASGSQSPGAGSQGQRYPQNVERFGVRFVDKVWETLLEIETETDVDLNASTYRFPITYDLLEYDTEASEFGGLTRYPMGGTYHYGGIECAASRGWSDDDYATHAIPEDMNCLAIHFMLHNRPPSIFTRSQITAVDLAGLTIVTMPGELSMESSWEVLQTLEARYDVDPLSAWTWGFAQDHLLYIVPTNLRGDLPPFPGQTTPQAPDDYPDYAFSFLQGGYEPGMSPWGYKFGDYVVERAADAYAMMQDPEFEPALESVYPSYYPVADQEPFPIDMTDEDRLGIILNDIPDTVSRLEPLEFVWIGGDPGAEQPQAPLVVLERENEGGEFEEIMLPNYRRYDNRAFRFMTRNRLTDEDEWEWIARWEELKDFPVGNYRFRIDGHYLNDEGRQTYTINSNTFELVPNDEVAITAVGTADSLCGTLAYPAAERMNYFESPQDPGEVTGHFRMRHFMVPTAVADPLVTEDDVTTDGFTLTVMNGATEVATLEDVTPSVTTAGESVSGYGDVPVTRFCLDFEEALASGTYDAEIGITDLYGNSGATTLTFTIP